MPLAATPAQPARRSIADAIAFGKFACQYLELREQHPRARARTVAAYIRDDQGLSYRQFACGFEHGHDWRFTGTAYGGDDESYRGEGRAYCCLCGADGDA